QSQMCGMLGLWLVSVIDEGSDLLMWVKAVATAILAGVIAEILVHPPGALASVPDFLRYGALIVGFIVFMLTRRSIFTGVVSGEVVMLLGKWWLGCAAYCWFVCFDDATSWAEEMQWADISSQP